jgi:tyrosyl-tRNA synthetase
MKNGFLDELTWRGLLHQTTSPELAAHLSSGARAGYAGFDPTSDSLTIGNFMGIKLLAHLQRAGHRPIVVSGGGTGLIGDPSGKSAERQLLTADAVAHNVSRQREIFARVIDFSAGGDRAAKIVNNGDWLRNLGYIDVLRDVGKHFSVNQMIVRDSVKSRLEGREQGISYTEFSYMILQAYDFLHLFRTAGCTVQLGGADQWGNIVSGIDLVRRTDAKQVFGLTTPLIATATSALLR